MATFHINLNVCMTYIKLSVLPLLTHTNINLFYLIYIHIQHFYRRWTKQKKIIKE